ncbi:hypothetical protein DH2020_041118 [Rehmannia glutinosa]|uniref:Protein kinase domain-containing protein n=1 Tax=Rehmannia glutinosa TaxID=99300 RepID=A0ABR0USA4_REHGL
MGVAIDVAKALSYLHRDCQSRILHLDVKPENILINENYCALVSNFGLSKLKERDESRNGVSEKCDVYSYGMVLLEIIGGRRNIYKMSKKKFEFFPRIVVEKLRDGKLMEIVDERLVMIGGINDERVLQRMVVMALWCIREKAKMRRYARF